MAKQKRNHYIPEFLINNFASRSERAKKWVWQFRRGVDPKELSTRDVAVAKYFYGGSQTGLEGQLGKLETRIAPVILAVIGGDPPSLHSEDLARFIYFMCARPRSLRIASADAATEMLTSFVSEKHEPRIREILESKLEPEYEQRVDDYLKGLPKRQRKAAAKKLRKKKGQTMEQLRQGLYNMDLGEMLAIFRSSVSAEKFRAAAEKGQLQGLSRLFEEGPPIDSLKNATWRILRRSTNGFILGDCGAFAVDEEGRPGSLFRFGKDGWREIYLPIGVESVLVAQRKSHPIFLNPEQVNRCSATLSELAFFASENAIAFCELAAVIGDDALLLDEDETEQMSSDIWDELADEARPTE